MMNKRTNEAWLAALRSEGLQREDALADLRKIIFEGLPYALSKWISPDDPRFSPFAEETAQETILRVDEKLDTFQGKSQFTTWVHTIAVRVALTELRRAKWKEVSLDSLMEDREGVESSRELPDEGHRVEATVEQREMMAAIQYVMENQLTEKQRTVIMAVALRGMPLEEVARRLKTNRNALYKLLHDARLKLKKNLAQSGIDMADILAAFDRQ